jgi:hypothetical protein
MNAAPKEISDGKNNKSCPPGKTEKYAKHERYKEKARLWCQAGSTSLWFQFSSFFSLRRWRGRGRYVNPSVSVLVYPRWKSKTSTSCVLNILFPSVTFAQSVVHLRV